MELRTLTSWAENAIDLYIFRQANIIAGSLCNKIYSEAYRKIDGVDPNACRRRRPEIIYWNTRCRNIHRRFFVVARVNVNAAAWEPSPKQLNYLHARRVHFNKKLSCPREATRRFVCVIEYCAKSFMVTRVEVFMGTGVPMGFPRKWELVLNKNWNGEWEW